MEMIELRLHLRNVVATFFVAITLGCDTTKNVNLVENPDATSRPSQIQVLTKSGARIVVYEPIVREDSVRGYTGAERTTPVIVAVSDIQSARTRQLSGGRTALLTLGIVAVALLAAWVALLAIIFSDDSY